MGIFRHKLAQATKSLSLFIATLAFALLPTLTAIAAPGDYSWRKTPYQFQGDAMGWRDIASSADGTKLAAAVGYGFIYTSSDAGTTWTEQTAAGSRSWSSIAMSSDGTKLAAAVNYGGSIYTSTDSGATWAQQTAAGSRSWQSIAMSSDGTKLAAVGYGSSIYLAEQEGPATVSVALPSIPSTNQADMVADPVKGATLSITSSECYSLNSAGITTLSPSSVTVPANVTILGGIGFDVSCVVNGGSADATVALNAHYADTTKVRVYKTTTTPKELVDVTDQVVIKNEVINGKMVTTISYTLQDGQDFDEDGLANGTIVDPLYIGVDSNTPASPATPVAGGSLASTGMNIVAAIAAAAGLIAAAVIVLVATRRSVGLSRS